MLSNTLKNKAWHWKCTGFTLIELLIVLFIISIVTTVALMTVGRSDNRRLQTFTNELAESITLAEEQAMLQPAILGLVIENNRYEFMTYRSLAVGKPSVWMSTVDHDILGRHAIPDDIRLSVVLATQTKPPSDAPAEKKVPQIIISTNGDLTPFMIYISKKGGTPRYAIKGEADGNVTIKSLP